MMQVGPCCSLGNPEHSADLGVLEAFNIVQDDYCTLPVRQLSQRLREPGPEFIRFRGIAEGRCHGVIEFICIPDLPPPPQVERCVGDDPVKPGAECLFGPESIQRPEGMQKALLHYVLGVLVCCNDRSRHCISTPLVKPYQSPERLAIAALCGKYKGSFARRGQFIRHAAFSPLRQLAANSCMGQCEHVHARTLLLS
jgi:hypothetical protein